jgi:hypothetical protein
LVANLFSGFATVFELEDAGVAEFLEVLKEFLGNVEFEAGAFEFEAFPTDALFAEANDQADDFAVKAGSDLVFVDDFHGAVDEHRDDGFFNGVGAGAAYDDFAGGLKSTLGYESNPPNPNRGFWPPPVQTPSSRLRAFAPLR